MATTGILGVSCMVIIIVITPTRTVDYDDDKPDIPAEDLVWYTKNSKGTYYKDPKNGVYYKNQYGNFLMFDGTYSQKNHTFYKDPKGKYRKDSNGEYYLYMVTTSTTKRPARTTTTRRLSTLVPPNPEVFQNFYMKELEDNLPPIEQPMNCTFCPRVYIPVCGDDGRSYTNTCKLVCMNRKKSNKRKAKVAYMGICQTYNDPYEY